ncbi:MAG: outer membrane efflux protein [uncultured bacterium]|nr:MAG: outer membrane efflux protein [uncultured bacterium]
MQRKNIFTLIFLICFGGHTIVDCAFAETVNYNYILDKAIENSFDLKISTIDVDISKAVVQETKSLYYPTLKSQFYSEYAHDMTDGIQTFSSVGTSIVNSTTKYQDLFTVSLSYDLYDFGIKGRKLKIAKKDVSEKKLVYDQSLRDLKLKIIDLYTRALITYKELNSKEEIYPVYKDLFTMKEQLYTAGTSTKIEVADEAIKMAKTADEINTLKTRYKMVLKDLAYFTQEKYDPDTVELLDYPEVAESYVSNTNFEKDKGPTYKLGIIKKEARLDINDLDYEQTPDYKIYEIEIEKKEAELQIMKRQRLPVVGLYSSYNFYGSDKNDFFDTMNDFQDRSLSVGFSASMTPFDGFKTSANIKRLELELARLKLAREQKLAELKNKYEKLNEEALYYDAQAGTQEDLLVKVNERLLMIEKLAQQELIDKPALLSQKADLIKQKLELEKAIISRVAAIKKLDVYANETHLPVLNPEPAISAAKPNDTTVIPVSTDSSNISSTNIEEKSLIQTSNLENSAPPVPYTQVPVANNKVIPETTKEN